ncbi:hypothetical protein C6Q22_04665 [Burkholderia multivorans]|uniref:Uncharacterized protein n=1 Tax=Burkholderia multivorans CGD2 TaxID=513052 RepID=B9BRC3_9BURK|nr:hypothetical protein BURMUCGD2_3940 [Burkholderia multivorans CGD2]EEE11964.1 hypothetical protein BURMUCGD2M_3928 [Burkholderia multivorans CGD2M]PRE21680.1 hypothetical protein C6P79_30680 [Burkholderia multivorans]PRF27617.1 hypothetical protein C6Q03_02805 [Burkholderia multivorans]PRF30769.1 hypothetical protein C6Q08_19780 [Burkholderia multivorans]
MLPGPWPGRFNGEIARVPVFAGAGGASARTRANAGAASRGRASAARNRREPVSSVRVDVSVGMTVR